MPSELRITDARSGKQTILPIQDSCMVELKQYCTEEDDDRNDSAPLLIYDPAFQHTAVIRSSICWVDGKKGELWYRGIPIEALVQNSTFTEVAHLLIYGHLPRNRFESDDWNAQISLHTQLHVNLQQLMRAFNYDSHPMGMFIATMAAMSTFHPEANPALQGPSIYNLENKKEGLELDSACGTDLFGESEEDSSAHFLVNKQIKRILGKAITVAAQCYRHRIGRAPNRPRNDLPYPANFLAMLDGMGEDDYQPHPTLVRAIDQLFIIHAEHEMNCSTAAMLHIGSSGVDPYSAVAGAAAALYGPLHGGATESVLRMLEEIKNPSNVYTKSKINLT